MSEDLAQDILLDHFKNPRHPGLIPHADIEADGINPLCGDKVHLTIQLDGDRFSEIKADTSGCVISQAAASILTAALEDKTIEEAKALGQRVRGWLMGQDSPADWGEEDLDDLEALRGVRKHPSRVKCALLGWNILLEGINKRSR